MSLKRVVKTTVFFAATMPLASLIVRGFGGELGANPIEALTHDSGIWALRFLLVTLAVSPLREITGWRSVIGLRRMLGLFAFFYATLHLGTYVVLDQFFAFSAIVDDVVRRPYITAGFGAFVLLVPLALTSTTAMIRRLGGKKWRRLHRTIYLCATMAVVHYLWLVKADARAPLLYGAVLTALLGFRVVSALSARAKRMPRRPIVPDPPSPRTSHP